MWLDELIRDAIQRKTKHKIPINSHKITIKSHEITMKSPFSTDLALRCPKRDSASDASQVIEVIGASRCGSIQRQKN